MTADVRGAARDYLDRGLSVIALSGKRPNTKFHPRGLSDAMFGAVEDADDEALLTRVFTDPTTTGVGIVLARPYFVVDIDGEDGARQYADIMGTTDVPDTWVAKTGRGLHVWFASFEEVRSTKLGPKLDVKGVGGYVAAPPSQHPDGPVYTWLVAPGEVEAPIELPEKLQTALAREEKPERDRTPYTNYQLSLSGGVWKLREAPAEPDLSGLVRAVREAAEGNRNNTLAWAAMAARDDGANREEALDKLVPAAVKSGLSVFEARATIKSAYRRRPR